MRLIIDRPIPGKIVGLTGYVFLSISWAGYFLGKILWPSVFAPWPCVAAVYGCGLAFFAGILAMILSLKRWPWWFVLTLAGFVSYGYIALNISDI